MSCSDKRIGNVDGIRAISCMAIVAFHLYMVAEYTFSLIHTVISSWFGFVIIFMILSGYGICCGYLDKFNNGQIDIEKFYVKRYSKILPFFAVITIIGVIYEHNLRGLAEGFIEITLLYGLLPNNSNIFLVNGVCWTLGTIFVFYLIFPFLSILLKNKKRALWSFVIFVLIHICCKTIFMTEKFVVDNYIESSSIMYSMVFFFAGGLIYLYQNEIIKFVSRYQLLMFLICVLITIGLTFVLNEFYEFRIYVYLLSGVIWIIYAVGAKKSILNNKLFGFISKYSMEIYLSHMIILKVICILKLPAIMGNNVISYCLLYIVLLSGTIIFDISIKYIIDKFFQKIKKEKKI